ncbi:MAG: methyltransferase domain-containing protein [Candidatus Thiodiazotropha sp. 6PLUC4]
MREFRRLKLRSCQQSHIQEWFNSQLGESLAAQESEYLQQHISAMFGYHVVQIGHLKQDEDLLRVSPARNRIVMGVTPGGKNVDLQAEPYRLPFAGDCVDGILLPHTLDFSSDPHQVLREVERVLIPEGKLLITGFNPWSLWGGVRLLRLRSTIPPWCGHFFSSRRVLDWLSLLGFDLLDIHFLNYRPPIQRPGISQRLQFLEQLGENLYPNFGGVYIILAVKRVVTLTHIRPKWSVKKRVLPTAAEPTIRNGT